MQDRDPHASVVTRDDYRLTNLHALVCTGSTFLVYAMLASISFAMGGFWQLVLIGPLAFVLQYFFNALHYCTHDNFVNGKKANYMIGTSFGCLTMVNFALYKPYHMQHHSHLFTEKDPEPTDRSIVSRGQYLFEMFTPLFFLDNWVQSIKTMFRTRMPNIFGRDAPYLNATDKRRVAINNAILAAWLLGMTGLTYVAGWVAVWLYWAPLLVSMIMANFVILPEHYLTDHDTGRNHVNSRTITSGPLTRFFIVGLNYHGEHHLYPGVPFYRLPELHRRIGADMKHRQDTYLAFHWKLFGSLPWRASEVQLRQR